MREIKGLSYEQNMKYRHAIDRGYFDTWEDDPRKWKHTFAGTFIWKHPQRVKVIDTLSGIVGHTAEWGDLDNDTLYDLVEELSENLAPSSAKTICAELKAVINANRKKVPSEDFMRILTVKGGISQHVYLTTDEMRRIMRFSVVGNLERFVRRTFVVQMLTGARRCDAERLTINNCDIDTRMLSYVPQKTPNIIVNVPVDERYGLRDFLIDETHMECCRSTFNDTLRAICCRCRIDSLCTIQRRGEQVTAPKYELVSSHTGRRSFATNLYLAGVSIEDIALMMGHGTNIETTKRYICAERQLSRSVMDYFRPYEKLITIPVYDE